MLSAKGVVTINSFFLPLSCFYKTFFWLVLLLCSLASTTATASHFRYAHITWEPTGNTNEVVFTVSASFRRAAPGTGFSQYNGSATDGGLAVGDVFSESIGGTSLLFGDGASTFTLLFKVDAINTVSDWVIAHAINPATGNEWIHRYPGPGPYTAKIDTCCRTSVEHNNPNLSYEVSTIVDISPLNSSPRSAVTPIVACPRGPCIFQLPLVDIDQDTLTTRLSTAVEAGDPGFSHPGAGTANPLTVNSSGLVTWDSTSFPVGLYSTSITIEESRGGSVHGKVMLDFLINTDESLGNAPFFNVPPTPVSGTAFTVNGTTLSFTVQCSDPDAGDIVTIDTLGLPDGATMTPAQAIGNPATATFSWTPVQASADTVSFTCTDPQGNIALPHSVSVISIGAPVPAGPDRDNDLFCDGLTINQLINSGNYNVIDNFLKPPALLIGTAGNDLILAGGLGDQVYGLAGDDCIIGAEGDDYVEGGTGHDQIYGWIGHDLLIGDAGNDRIFGRDGFDVLIGGDGNDILYGHDDEDYLYGGAGNDIFYGGNDIDRIQAGPGDDQLFGEIGEDVLNGEAGNDVYDGGLGSDVCIVDPADLTPAVNCAVFPLVSSAPVLQTVVPDVVMDELSVTTITIVATDPDPAGGPEPVPGSALSFTQQHLPAFATLTDNGDRTATLVISPQPGDAGSYPGVVIRVDDDGEPVQSDLLYFDITVTGGNEAPVLNTIGSHIVNEANTKVVQISATDADAANTLTFLPVGLPPFVSFVDHGNRTATMTISPALGDAGQFHGLSVRVLDNGIPIMDDSEIFSIIIEGQVNQAPVIAPVIGNQSVEEGQTLVIPVTATDPDGDGLSFSGLNMPTFMTLVDNGGGSATITLAPQVGDANLYSGVVVQVTDDASIPQGDSNIFSITVQVAVTDTDLDTIVDAIDNCITVPNPAQTDTDNDGMGDACDTDDDNDGLTDVFEASIGTNPLLVDTDGDGFSDGLENINGSDPLLNTDTPANGDINESGQVDAADLMLAYRFVLGLSTATQQQLLRADVAPEVNGIPQPDGIIDTADILLLTRKVFAQ